MGKAEYIVMGNWAVQHNTGKIRHLLCKRWCIYFSETNVPEHPCDALVDKDDDRFPRDRIIIPAMVVTTSNCLRNRK